MIHNAASWGTEDDMTIFKLDPAKHHALAIPMALTTKHDVILYFND
jgi:hypothetical protein